MLYCGSDGSSPCEISRRLPLARKRSPAPLLSNYPLWLRLSGYYRTMKRHMASVPIAPGINPPGRKLSPWKQSVVSSPAAEYFDQGELGGCADELRRMTTAAKV